MEQLHSLHWFNALDANRSNIHTYVGFKVWICTAKVTDYFAKSIQHPTCWTSVARSLDTAGIYFVAEHFSANLIALFSQSTTSTWRGPHWVMSRGYWTNLTRVNPQPPPGSFFDFEADFPNLEMFQSADKQQKERLLTLTPQITEVAHWQHCPETWMDFFTSVPLIWRKVVLEQTLVQAWRDLYFTPLHPGQVKSQVKMLSPLGKCDPHWCVTPLTCHPPPDSDLLSPPSPRCTAMMIAKYIGLWG